MRRFLLYFSYIGTGFRGVQRLIPRHVKTNLITPAVTEVIEDALKRRLLLEKLPILHTASRTDAGVHALRSAASVDLDVPNLPPDAITVTLNHYFSKIQCPIRILSTQVVKPDFSSRALPLYRSYLYRFAVQKKDSGFQSDFSFTHLVPTPIQEYKRCHFVQTDAGVHALRSAASVDLDVPNLTPDAITVTLNHYFSKIQCPIRILSTQVVKPDFSSRALPLYRSYLYRFAVQKKDSGFQSDFSFTHLVPTPIQEYKRCHFVHDSDFDIKAVESVLPLFDGTKDYASFMSNYRIAKLRVEPPPTTVRRLDSVSLHPGRPLIPGYFTDQYFDYWEVKVVGKSFLYKQVRRTVAVLIGVGQGKVNYKDVESLFLNPGTWLDGLKSVPAYGLYLTDVVYSKEALEAPAKGQENVVKRTVGEEVEGEEEGGEEEEEEEEEEEDRREERRTVKVATSKDTKQLSINEKINLRSSKIKEEQRKAVVRDETRKLSTRHAIALAKSKYAKGLTHV
ncbi:tRNA pseudouridine synthase-like 1 [Nilaparvata lugens]|uniref:tRNA pseudouridine synthase-like 1 n=1 Tax=Nilaparvata lugens TaxID=108931 RepID=UPI00193CABB7|nr:tRNA pseudouridine synthase-like 1 [Nilaparvata lugens]